MTDDRPPLDRGDESVDWDTLARYLAGESPAAEARSVAAWLADHPADAEVLAALDAAVKREATATATVDVERALRRVKARRDAEPAVVPRRRPAPAPWETSGARRVIGWRTAGLAAAAAAALLAIGVVRWGGPGGDSRPADAVPRTVATAVGQRDSLRLPDGTRVVLAPRSRLVVAAGYGAAERTVELEGAGWFAVHHDESRPFTVRAGSALVRDIGTAFAVRTDSGTGVAVAVTEGVVVLRAAAPAPGDTGVVLAAGDRGVLRPDGRASADRGVISADDVAWTQGRLVYRDAPLDVVSADLRRWYGAELEVSDSVLARRHLTATFEDEPIDRVLDVIALALDATVERRGNVAVLRPARRGAAARR